MIIVKGKFICTKPRRGGINKAFFEVLFHPFGVWLINNECCFYNHIIPSGL